MRDLGFGEVDDLGIAASRAALGAANAAGFVPHDLGPYLELQAIGREYADQRQIISGWLADGRLSDFRSALRSQAESWIEPSSGRLAFKRCCALLDPLSAVNIAFEQAMAKAAELSGFHRDISMQLVAAMNELEDNVYEHSKFSNSGLVAFQALQNRFEFAVSDRGIGVVASLKNNPSFANIQDHGIALLQVVREGVSSRGVGVGGGFGFRRIFTGLANINCDLRFRSGDHAITIQGSNPDPKNAFLSQKCMVSGFIASVSCSI